MYDWLPFGVNPIQDVCHNYETLANTSKDYNLANITDIELKFGVVSAEMYPKHVLFVQTLESAWEQNIFWNMDGFFMKLPESNDWLT